MEVASHCKNLSLLWIPSFPAFGAGIFEVEEAVKKHVIEGELKEVRTFQVFEGVLSWIVENVEKTEGRSVQGSENGGFFEVLRNQIPKFGVFICIFTLKIQIICGFEPQITSSDVGS